MTYHVAVLYGKPTDPDAFDEYYRTTHVPLALAVPHLSEFTWGKCRSLDGSEPPYYLIANLYFPTEEALQQGLGSAEMQAAGADVANFATGGVSMFVAEEQSAERK